MVIPLFFLPSFIHSCILSFFAYSFIHSLFHSFSRIQSFILGFFLHSFIYLFFISSLVHYFIYSFFLSFCFIIHSFIIEFIFTYSLIYFLFLSPLIHSFFHSIAFLSWTLHSFNSKPITFSGCAPSVVVLYAGIGIGIRVQIQEKAEYMFVRSECISCLHDSGLIPKQTNLLSLARQLVLVERQYCIQNRLRMKLDPQPVKTYLLGKS